MGVFIQWCPPHAEAPYDKARVFRSPTENGTFLLIATQVVSDTTFYDVVGTTSSFYKVQFFDTVSNTPSSFSVAVQPGTVLGYCTPEDLRHFTNLDTTDITDEAFCQIIPFAGSQLNHDIQIFREDEEVKQLDTTRTNVVDGTNTTFFVKEFPIGDTTGDMEVTIADIEAVEVQSDGTKVTFTVSSINQKTGKFVLASAPTVGSTLFVTYHSAPLSVGDPHPLVRLACIYLVASIAYSKINIGKSTTIKLGSHAFVRHMKSYHEYYVKYQRVVSQINNRMAGVEPGDELDLQFGVGGFY